MIIECAGTRGSIACGGSDYQKYGGDTISVRITTQSGEIIIIDAGTGIRKLGNDIVRETNKESPRPLHLLFTHYHLDHILGIPFFKPIFNENQKITMYGPLLEGTDGVESAFKNVMMPPYSPVSFDGHIVKAEFDFKTISEETFSIGSAVVTTINISHNNHGGLGFRIEENGKIFVLLTDNELQFQHQNGRTIKEYEEFSKNADLLFHDAQFTNATYRSAKGWGHSTIEDVLSLGKNANCKQVGLFHYSPESSDRDLDKIFTFYPQENGSTTFFPLIQGTKFTL